MEEKTIAICFLGTVAAEGELTLCSKRLNFPYTTQSVRCFFPLNTNRTVQISFYISPDDTVPATGKPTGQSIFSPYSPIDYIVGDNELKEIVHQVEVKEMGTYIKVYAKNTDAFPHTVDAQAMIAIA